MSTAEVLRVWREVLTDMVRADQPDLSLRQWSILLNVYLTPGPHTVRGLSHDLNIPKPAVSRALDALSIHGFVRRARDQKDRRIVIVQKTEEGDLYVDKLAALVGERSGGAAPVAMFG